MTAEFSTNADRFAALRRRIGRVLRRGAPDGAARQVGIELAEIREELRGRLGTIAHELGELRARTEQIGPLGLQLAAQLDEIREEIRGRLATLAHELAQLRLEAGNIRPLGHQLSIHLDEVRTELGGKIGSAAHELGQLRVEFGGKIGSAAHEIGLVSAQSGFTNESLRRVYELAYMARAILEERMPVLNAGVVGLSTRLDEGVQRLQRQIGGRGGRSGASDRYLDLLEAQLVGKLDADSGVRSGALVDQDALVRGVGFDWPESALTMIGEARMRNLRMLTERVLDEGVPGDLLEAGVWRGGACIYMAGILAAHGDLERRIFVADSFRGLPPPDPARYPADAGDQHSTYDELRISADEVRGNFRRYGLLGEQIHFLEGWFKDTLPAAPIDRLALLRLDGDMYESTIQALEALYDKVSPGGFVIIDDYILGPCAKAVDDFRAARGITAPLEPVDTAAVWWRV